MTRVFAHRGSAHRAPENSLEAFVEARRLGADGIELDVRRSADGAFVVHHDPVLADLGPIAQCRVADLPDSVPLLSAALEATLGMVVNVEVKNDPSEPGYDASGSLAAQLLAEIIELREEAELLVSSFDLETVLAIKEAGTGVATGLLVGFGTGLEAALATAVVENLDAVHPFVLEVTEAFVGSAHAQGLSVHAWTVNAAHDLLRMGELGVDAVISDDVALARSVLDPLDRRAAQRA
jgi:glycerophosphoryl diester phosphodiesterase